METAIKQLNDLKLKVKESDSETVVDHKEGINFFLNTLIETIDKGLVFDTTIGGYIIAKDLSIDDLKRAAWAFNVKGAWRYYNLTDLEVNMRAAEKALVLTINYSGVAIEAGDLATLLYRKKQSDAVGFLWNK